MEETHYLGVPNPVNMYGMCKAWHNGIFKVLVASGSIVQAASSSEIQNYLEWNFEDSPVLSLPDNAQIISIVAANPLVVTQVENAKKYNRRTLIAITYCVHSILVPSVPEPEPAPAPKPTPTRGTTSSYLNKVLMGSRPPPPGPAKPPQQPEHQSLPTAAPQYFLSIMGTNSSEMDDWNTICSDKVTFEIFYVPFVLAKFANQSSVMFLLSGSDKKLHIYHQIAQHVPVIINQPISDQTSDLGQKQPEKIEESDLPKSHDSNNRVSPEPTIGKATEPAILSLPLLDVYPSPIVSIDILESVDGLIHVVAGCQDGTVVLTSGVGNRIDKLASISLDGPITSVKIFQIAKSKKRKSYRNDAIIPTAEDDQAAPNSIHPTLKRINKHITKETGIEIGSGVKHNKDSQTSSEDFAINIVVASAVGFAAVFKNVFENQFDEGYLLPDSDKHDSVLSLAVADIDNDGNLEILVGTYGQKILAYSPNNPPSFTQQKSPNDRSNPITSNKQNQPPNQKTLSFPSKAISIPTGAASDEMSTKVPSPGNPGISDISAGMAKLIDQNDETVLLGLRPSTTSNTTNKDQISTDTTNTTHSLFSKSSLTSTELAIASPNVTDANPPQAPENLYSSGTHSLIWHQSLCHPVFQIVCDDFLNSGFHQIVVSSLFGLHLLNGPIDPNNCMISKRMQLLSEIYKLERMCKKRKKHEKLQQ